MADDASPSNVIIRNLRSVASTVTVQLTDKTWDAVVTSRGKGTFLMRRRRDQQKGECLFDSCEIRRIDDGHEPATSVVKRLPEKRPMKGHDENASQ